MMYEFNTNLYHYCIIFNKIVKLSAYLGLSSFVGFDAPILYKKKTASAVKFHF